MRNKKDLNLKSEDLTVLYVTTKNIDYIRNVQIIKMLRRRYQNVKIIYSKSKNYYVRIIEVNLKMLFEKKAKYNIIFFGFLPQLILGNFYKKRRNDPIIVIDFIISVYNTLVYDRKKIREKSLISKILKLIDTKIASKADIVYTDTKTQAKYFEKEFNINKNKFKILYLEANTDIYNNKDDKLNLKVKNDINNKAGKLKLKTNNEFIVLWFGSVLPLQGVDIILESAKLLENNNNIKFYIIGNIKKLHINYQEYTNIKFISWISDKELAEYIKKADLCLAGHFSNKSERANREIPGKAFIYKAMKKKMILGNSEANHEIFNENGKDIFYVERGNAQEMAKKIEEIWREHGENTNNRSRACRLNNSSTLSKIRE